MTVNEIATVAVKAAILRIRFRRWQHRPRTFLVLVGQLLAGSVGWSADPIKEPTKEPAQRIYLPHFNVESSTMGGMQVWSDLRVCGEWRIQKNAITGHCRLLDAKNVRRMWGSLERCDTEFARVRADGSIPDPRGRVIVTLHGLGATRRCMEPLGAHLRKSGVFNLINVSYASTRGDFSDHAANLREVLSHLEGVDELYFVCHSMGNLVLRQYLDDCRNDPERSKSLARIKRIVMLGPPNNGAQLAERFRDLTLLEPIVGSAATRLAREGRAYTDKLARPTCEFGIIAGGLGNSDGRNPILDGDDDLVVRVEETRLPGASDFITVTDLHRSMLYDPKVHEYVLNYLVNGYFVSEMDRHPIPESVK